MLGQRVRLKRFCHLGELRSVNQFEGLALGEPQRLVRVNSAGYKNPSIHSLGCHHPEELPDRFHANFENLPTFALDERCFSLATQAKINASIGSPAADIFNDITTSAEN